MQTLTADGGLCQDHTEMVSSLWYNQSQYMWDFYHLTMGSNKGKIGACGESDKIIVTTLTTNYKFY
jgi:hypothetical protein